MGVAYSDEKAYGSARYHGMKVGGVHNWTYPDGQWTERKVAPDRWDVTFTSLKRRNRRAPRNSGVEVGSGYHWLIVAHQWVEKLDANTYSTQLEGSKYLLAFKKPDWPVWNTQFKNQKRRAKDRAIAALEDVIRRLRESPETFEEVVDQAALVDLAVYFEQEVRQRDAEGGDLHDPGAKGEEYASAAGRRAIARRRSGARPKRGRLRRERRHEESEGEVVRPRRR